MADPFTHLWADFWTWVDFHPSGDWYFRGQAGDYTNGESLSPVLMLSGAGLGLQRAVRVGEAGVERPAGPSRPSTSSG